MPLKRYLLVKGALDPEGHPLPVSNPHAGIAQTGAATRYVGLKPVAKPPKHVEHLGDVLEPTEEVIEDHPDLRRAVKDKCLVLVYEMRAHSHADAVELATKARLAAAAAEEQKGAAEAKPAAPQKGGEGKPVAQLPEGAEQSPTGGDVAAEASSDGETSTPAAADEPEAR